MLARTASASARLVLQLPHSRRLRVSAPRAAMASALPLRHVFVPATRPSDRPPPLVVLLHGTGADEHDLIDAGEELQQALGGELAIASVRAPLSLGYGGYAWFEGYSFAPERKALEHTVRGAAATLRRVCRSLSSAAPRCLAQLAEPPFAHADSTSKVIAFLEAAPAALGTDPERQFLFCFSQGATIGWTVFTSAWPRPGLLKGACLLRCALNSLACAHGRVCA